MRAIPLRSLTLENKFSTVLSRTREAILESCVMFLLCAYFQGIQQIIWMNIQTQYTHNKLRYIYVDTCSNIQTAKQLKEDNTEGDEKPIHTYIRCPKNNCLYSWKYISCRLLFYISESISNIQLEPRKYIEITQFFCKLA